MLLVLIMPVDKTKPLMITVILEPTSFYSEVLWYNEDVVRG